MERKLKLSSELRDEYNKIISEYIQKGYISEIPTALDNDEGYFIPHHAVVRQDKTTTKVRIVLDASAKTHTGFSLNDILHTGPNLQADLFTLLLNFRLFPIPLTADLKQMYLQIEVAEPHRKYQKILYRFNNQEPVRSYQFNRLPFGLTCSPYLAMRIIRQLAEDERPRFPEAANIAKSELYMDDVVTSVLKIEEAIKLIPQLIELFSTAGFELVKWASHPTTLIEGLPESHRTNVEFSKNENLKVLGLSWAPPSDTFYFTTSNVDEKCTKRTILSMIARLFDVLGFVSPIILYAKLLIKELWTSKIDWDETPPPHIIQRYTALTHELPLLSKINIPRHIGVVDGSTVNIVAFCDASLKAYGCAIYLHVTNIHNNISVRLLCSKSKVSPVKIITLARLELCAALLLSKLVRLVYNQFNSRYPIANIYAFSDSTIALSWIKSSPHRWSIFVNNRIAQIHENLDPACFHHVTGSENPSDCLSRGTLPSQLVELTSWWSGPSWILSPPSSWPISLIPSLPCEQLPEFNSKTFTATSQCEPNVLYTLAHRMSSWDKLLRIVVYILRFINKLPHSNKILISEINTAEIYVLRALQNVHFADDISHISKSNAPAKYLRKLCPFLDEDGVLRIGGRLSNSELPFSAQHPALLPKQDHIVNLIIDHYHTKNCHTGPNLLMAILRQRFWILSARNVVRKRVHLCNKCFRLAPTHPTPKMADLPSYRVREAKAFVHTGVDYAGPLKITLSRRRGQRSQKAYICLFICLTVKAVHIEVVSDLTTESFLAAFKRFISRRGPVSYIYSDNGTNFVGAKAKLDEMYKFLFSSNMQNSLYEELRKHRIEWKMIPPRAPHFGGVWESNIKSLKTHLFRVIGTQILTYEELLTVVVQIEALLNSRPLCLLSSDPQPEILTPAHFIMATPLQYLPATEIIDDSITPANRKELLDKLVQSYWKRWRLEYLHTLQVRQKWHSSNNPIKIGTIVLVDQSDVPPLHWPLGVVDEVYPGSDNIIRVASVKTQNGRIKRPIIKLYPIPSQ